MRPQAAPPGSFRPGSIGRQPGLIVCEGPERFLLLFGWAVGDPDAPAARLLDQLGVSPAEVRVRIGEMLRALTRGA